jgi:hypothetical protein
LSYTISPRPDQQLVVPCAIHIDNFKSGAGNLNYVPRRDPKRTRLIESRYVPVGQFNI